MAMDPADAGSNRLLHEFGAEKTTLLEGSRISKVINEFAAFPTQGVQATVRPLVTVSSGITAELVSCGMGG